MNDIKLTRLILVVLIGVQIAVLFVMFSGAPQKLPAYLGFAKGQQGSLLGWGLAALTATAYVWSAASISMVRMYLFRLDWLKMLAVICALLAGVIEEVIFRKILMDYLDARGFGAIIQIVASAFAFGIAHAAWGVKSVAAGINAMVSTTILGAALAVVYLAADRNLAPCVIAHCVTSALIEPGLMLAAVSGRLGVWREIKQSDD